jgi:hypothetical protein
MVKKIIVVLFLVNFLFPQVSHAKSKWQVYNYSKAELQLFDNLADAIYKAENSKRYPYGIIVPGKRLSKEKARVYCINTIKHKYFDWSHEKKTPFLNYLASKYAPIGAGNDPTNLNRNWLKNVSHFMGSN